MHSWQQLQALHVLLQVFVVILVVAFLLELLALFVVVVAFLQEVHAFLEELFPAFLLQHISYPKFELLPLLQCPSTLVLYCQRFKLLERGTWVSTSIAICLCSLSLTSLTFVREHALLKIVLSCLSTCLWILIIFSFVVIIVHCVIMAPFSCLLISLFVTSFCIIFYEKCPSIGMM